MKSFFFDYIYYRVTQAYFKWDGRNSITALLAVSMLQVLIIGDICIFIARLIWHRHETAPYAKLIAYVGLAFFFVFVIINFFKYKNKYHLLKKHWKDEPQDKRKLKGVLVVLSLVIPWMLLIIIGVKK
jgi:ABC-type Fe3+ transport system permease subunit